MWVRIAFPNDLSNYNHWLYQGIVSCRETFQTEAFVLQFQLWEAPNVPYLSQLRDFAMVFIPAIRIILPFFLQLRLGRLQPVSCWQLIHGTKRMQTRSILSGLRSHNASDYLAAGNDQIQVMNFVASVWPLALSRIFMIKVCRHVFCLNKFYRAKSEGRARHPRSWFHRCVLGSITTSPAPKSCISQ